MEWAREAEQAREKLVEQFRGAVTRISESLAKEAGRRGVVVFDVRNAKDMFMREVVEQDKKAR